MHETAHGDWLISDDPARFDLARAHGWIATESYWAEAIPLAVFEKAIRNCLTVGAYGGDGEMAAMARVVTDRATFGWICDVFVGQAHRGQGLGKALMAYLMAHPDLQGFRRLHLATRDAQRGRARGRPPPADPRPRRHRRPRLGDGLSHGRG